MLRTQIIGCGAAGNKAVINLIEKNYLGEDVSYFLVNSTDRDIPAEYRNKSMIFGSSIYSGGCGKERSLGKQLLLEDDRNGIRNIDHRIDGSADFITICGSTEGGSGSASMPLIAKYIKQVLHIPVIVVLFFGFNDDARGMQNSIEVCQELDDDIGVISICNSKFKTGNKFKSESQANDHFGKIMRVLVGKDIHESTQNIDDTDLKKLVLTPGYLSIQTIEFPTSLKTTDQFNQFIDSAIDVESKSMESPNPSCKRLGVIFNVKNNNDNLDYSCTVAKQRFGNPYELFIHVQENDVQSVTIIAVGQNLPLEEVENIYNEYKKASAAVNRDKDKFFETMNAFKGNPDDGAFNMFGNSSNKSNIDQDKASFFKDFGIDLKSSSKDISISGGKAPKKVNSTNEY